MMFDIYTQEVKIKDLKGNEFTYELKPLTGKYLPKLYEVMRGMGGEGVSQETLDEKTMASLHEIAFQTMVVSYPKEDKEKLDLWVSQNLLKLLEAIVKVNIGETPTEK